MRIQNITYALCMAATANAVRLQTATQENSVDEVYDQLHDIDGKLNIVCAFLGQNCSIAFEEMARDIIRWNQPTGLAQVETSTENVWDWVQSIGETVTEKYLDFTGENEPYVTAALMGIIALNPMLAGPGIAAAIVAGTLNLDDYDITDEAKEEIMTMTNTITGSINNDSS